jgi:hypothetical protein
VPLKSTLLNLWFRLRCFDNNDDDDDDYCGGDDDYDHSKFIRKKGLLCKIDRHSAGQNKIHLSGTTRFIAVIKEGHS